MEMSTTFTPSSKAMSERTTRSRIGLPYLCSPIWGNGASRGALDAFVEEIAHRLGDREIAGGEQGDDPLAGDLHHMHLGEGRDVVDARVGPRIGEQHEAVLEIEADAICHGRLPMDSKGY